MSRPHDIGGADIDASIELSEHPQEDWQLLIDAIRESLRDDGRLHVDEVRRATEDVPPEQRREMSYYEREVAGFEQVAVEHGWLAPGAVDERLAAADGRREP